MDKFYVIYEQYTEFNKFEGEWNLEIETFYDLEKAKKFKESHECVSEMHGTTLMGPLKHCNEI